jgi:hypothetical protein
VRDDDSHPAGDVQCNPNHAHVRPQADNRGDRCSGCVNERQGWFARWPCGTGGPLRPNPVLEAQGSVTRAPVPGVTSGPGLQPGQSRSGPVDSRVLQLERSFVSIDHRTGATWLRRGYEIEERVPRFHFLVKPVENSQLRILTTLSLLNNQ